MRTVGQAFDVCHKSNPKPQFKRPEKAGDHEGDEKSPPNEMSVDDAIEKASGEKDATTVSPSNTSDPDAAVAAATKKEEQPEAVQADNLNDLMQFNRDEKIPNGTSDTNLDPLFAPGNPQAASVPDHNREVFIQISLPYNFSVLYMQSLTNSLLYMRGQHTHRHTYANRFLYNCNYGYSFPCIVCDRRKFIC